MLLWWHCSFLHDSEHPCLHLHLPCRKDFLTPHYTTVLFLSYKQAQGCSGPISKIHVTGQWSQVPVGKHNLSLERSAQILSPDGTEPHKSGEGRADYSKSQKWCETSEEKCCTYLNPNSTRHWDTIAVKQYGVIHRLLHGACQVDLFHLLHTRIL